jgi:hypothetical protein
VYFGVFKFGFFGLRFKYVALNLYVVKMLLKEFQISNLMGTTLSVATHSRVVAPYRPTLCCQWHLSFHLKCLQLIYC